MVANKLRTIIAADETHPLRHEFGSKHTDWCNKLRILHSKTKRYVQSLTAPTIETQSPSRQIQTQHTTVVAEPENRRCYVHH